MNGKKSVTGLGVTGLVFSLLGGSFLLTGICELIFLKDQKIVVMGYSFAAMGFVFFILGLLFLFLKAKIAKRKRTIREAGHYVIATVEKVICNYNIRYNRVNPYVVYCKYVDERGKEHRYRSKNLLFNPTEMFRDNQVKVYVDPANPKHYDVDIDSILPNVFLHTSGNLGKNLGMKICGIIFVFMGVIFAGIGLTVFSLTEASIDSWIIAIIFGSIGGPFLLIGAIFLLSEIQKKYVVNSLKNNGLYVYAIVKNVGVDSTVQYASSPLYFQCAYTAPNGVEHLFQSESRIGLEQEKYMGRQVKVYYKGEDFKKYYVALED